MLNDINIHKILFLDIETVPREETWENVGPELRELFIQKTAYRVEKEKMDVKEFYESNAGIWAEFGKIICISVGFITADHKIRIKSYYGHKEGEILTGFCSLLNDYFYSAQCVLCAHNGKEFDFPYLARRMMVHQIELPNLLQLHGKKPWEIPHIDTMELWKFGDYKHYTSLNLLAHIFHIPTPKDDIDGSMVAEVYYKEKDLERIKTYCEKDVLTLAQIFRKFRYEPLLDIDEVRN
ncbi:3'-5' exonuclease [Flavobacteriaceae bacterium Ap0902]|nr:3'-5' exonuclease [Flavobacteriaceae bacterium Ap0902]